MSETSYNEYKNSCIEQMVKAPDGYAVTSYSHDGFTEYYLFKK